MTHLSIRDSCLLVCNWSSLRGFPCMLAKALGVVISSTDSCRWNAPPDKVETTLGPFLFIQDFIQGLAVFITQIYKKLWLSQEWISVPSVVNALMYLTRILDFASSILLSRHEFTPFAFLLSWVGALIFETQFSHPQMNTKTHTLVNSLIL